MTNSDKPTRVVPCPCCKKSTRYDTGNPHRPFCSAQCKNEDIIQWADQGYRIPGKPTDPDELPRRSLQDEDDDQSDET